MNKVLKTKSIQILVFNILLLVLYLIFYGRFGDINVDSFREAYIPMQMLDGQVLYKNIFNIYAPLAYFINAFLMLLFGANLNTLYIAGLLATGGILTLVYKISCKFLPPLYGFVIVLFMIAVGVLGTNVFNYIFPYSYGMLYGLLCILGSIFCGLKNKFFWVYFLYSLAVCFKYEFIFLLPVLIWYGRKTNFIKSFSGFILPFLATSIILIVHGVKLEDVIASFQWVFAMTSTETLNYFYKLSGIKFSLDLIPLYFINGLKIIIPLLFLYYFRNIYAVIAAMIFLSFFTTPAILIYSFPLILVLAVFKYRNLNSKKVFIIASSILISVKVFFALLIQSYGIFFVPFALIPVFILLSKRLKKSFLIIIFLLSLVFGCRNCLALKYMNTQVNSGMGTFYADKNYADSLNSLVLYMKQNSDKNDTVVVYPEGLSLNVFADRKSDNKFYSMIPLYVETFGENLIKSRLEVIKPRYIVISNYDTSNYYFKHFGEDYALDLLSYITQKYVHKTTIGAKLIYEVYERK